MDGEFDEEPDDETGTDATPGFITIVPEISTLRECPLDPGMLFFEEGGSLPTMIDEALDIVRTENAWRLSDGGFHRGLVFRAGRDSNQLVTLVKDEHGAIKVQPLSSEAISLVLARRFCYITPTQKNPYKHAPLPKWFRIALQTERQYDFPVLSGLVHHPAVHLDGTFVTREGYDWTTESWVVAGWEDLEVPASPSAAEVAAAVALLREPFSEVIFVGDEIAGASPVKKPGVEMSASEANCLGMLLTGLLRRQMQDAPFFIVTAHQPGTAKGLVVQIVSQITQNDFPLISPLQSEVGQAEKQIGRVLKDHPDAKFIQFDEPDQTPSGGFYSRLLALIATSGGTVTIRTVFGRHADRLDTKRIIAFTGNNVTPDRDMVRRVSMIQLDVPVDGTLPQERVFAHPERSDKVRLLRWVADNRRDFIAAALTLINHWKANGRPEIDFTYDFPQWVHSVGGVLQNAGIRSWMENRKAVYAEAPESRAGAFLLAVVDVVGVDIMYTSRQLAAKLSQHPDYERLRDMLTWDDRWAKLLYESWGGTNMTYNLSRLLANWKDRLLTDGAFGRITVTNEMSRTHSVRWKFTVPEHMYEGDAGDDSSTSGSVS